MNRRLYVLVTRSSILLIVALVAAPLFDFWRFGRFVPAGSAALPIGAILPAAPESANAATRLAATIPGGDAAVAPGSSLPAAPGGSLLLDALPAGTAPVAARSGAAASRSAFEAWTAWGQIDPFWDGFERPARTAQASERVTAAPEPGSGAPAEGLDEIAAAPEIPVEPRPAARKPGPPRPRSVARPSEPIVETAGEEDAVDGEPAPDEQVVAAPPIDGWVIGQPAAPPTATEGGRLTPDPSPLPPPVPGGSVGPPRAMPHNPRPIPVNFPTAWIDAPAGSVGIGESFDVAVRVDSVDQMTSLPFHLMFDASLLSFVSAQTGPALGSVQPVLLASVNPNRPGDLAVGLSLIEASGSFSGSGDLIVLRFQAIASGKSDLSFSRATLRGAASEATDTRFTGASVVVR